MRPRPFVDLRHWSLNPSSSAATHSDTSCQSQVTSGVSSTRTTQTSVRRQVFLPAGEVDVKVTQAEELPPPCDQGSSPPQAAAAIHLYLASSSPPPPPGVTDYSPTCLLPYTTVLIRLTGFDLGPPPCPAPAPGWGESGAVDGGGKGECGGGGGMEDRGGY